MQKPTKPFPDAVRYFGSMPGPSIIRPKHSAMIAGFSEATFWREVRRGKIRVTKISARTSGTTADDLRAYLASKAGRA